MGKIIGIDVVLHEWEAQGTNAFNEPIDRYKDAVVVSNVLYSPTTSDDVIDENSLLGRKEVYTLAIPKGDTHNWVNSLVEFNGKTYKQFGAPMKGIDENIPLAWNKKVTVERYE